MVGTQVSHSPPVLKSILLSFENRHEKADVRTPVLLVNIADFSQAAPVIDARPTKVHVCAELYIYGDCHRQLQCITLMSTVADLEGAEPAPAPPSLGDASTVAYS